eukprot:Tbor_TRINITY_DN2910_c0_g1::TRINITY_DN2910_c0_g1_i1::g.1035::m.1035
MFRVLNLRLPKGKILAWTEGKSFGFAQVAREDGTYVSSDDPDCRRVIVHKSSIIQNPDGRSARNIRKGTEIEFEIAMFNERESATNVSLMGGEVLTNRNENLEKNINIAAMRSKLLSPGTTTRINDGQRVDSHDYTTSLVIDYIGKINKHLKDFEALNKRTLRIFEAIAQKKGIEKFPIGEEYADMKKKTWDKFYTAEIEARAARRETASGNNDDEEDHDELFSVKDEEEAITSDNNDDTDNNDKKNKLHVETRVDVEAKADDIFFNPDDLIKESSEISDEKGKKSKKGKGSKK